MDQEHINQEQIAKNIALLKKFKKRNGRRAKGVIDYQQTTPVKDRLRKRITERRIEKLTGKSIAEIKKMYAENKIEIDVNPENTPQGLLDSWTKNEIVYKKTQEEEDDEKE